MSPRVLLLAGLEPTGRAGLLADVAAVRALRGQPVAVPTAQTAQGVRTFTWTASPPRVLSAQVVAARELGPVHAVKCGMVPARAQLEAAQQALEDSGAWWVVDPVVRTSRGEPLTRLTARAYLSLAGPRVVLTPNLDEAGWLLGRPVARTVDEAVEAAEALAQHGFCAVLVKGGHLPDTQGLADVLATPGRVRVLEGKRLARAPGRRGTGCRLASALATELGRGRTLETAVRSARALVVRYLRTGSE
ncbi:bifunctional hydroxymethylpyrimidine kinase/phosphomethylpyrimidine kinase [Myxococcus virescens]|uniref:Hydroxymethylpyrimidine/phosphomethylpyrimidine kinase n=1 Tax=Myxococcus virescens TaxID=83456 RepID=A0A511HJ31_9BACT|nr:bifunctional hydroxymethylpyrimidine kinase/phosphomethylpyrimidine kinase [Myxococcus virescens]GEL73577.1 hydroxymethylpyrimidine/phosphomethylpyrimidine kinase [Myxococcus virescens]SDE52051.1 hydroxymethylpyrimidine/phosphomethylpyrimidine kinase [Myxococcus virescens]